MTFLLLAVQLKLKINAHAFVNCDASGVKTCYNVTFSVSGSLVANGNETNTSTALKKSLPASSISFCAGKKLICDLQSVD